jgi:two-component system, chemotaxis family, protein-glutamate methylesterase/glutaminase
MATPEAIFLLPGELYISEGYHRITTILGTCVSVCLYNKKSGAAGMNHYIHPQFKGKDVSRINIGAYGDLSLNQLISEMFKHDPESKNYVAKVYGGGMAGSGINKHFDIAELNIQMAKKTLAAFHIGVELWDVKNRGGVKIVFDTVRNIVFKVPIVSSAGNRTESKEKKFRVLIVEDSKSYGYILKKLIEKHDKFEVIDIASDAYQAREIIVRERPDIMTLDLVLPEVSGLQFLKKVMQHHPLPIVVISGETHGEADLSEECLAFGAKAVLNKRDITFFGSGKSEDLSDPVTRALCKALGL